MRPELSFISIFLATTTAVRIVQSNDNGWAVKNIRVFNEALVAAGNDVVLSAPADNESGTGSLDATPLPRTSPCQFDSCPANSPAIGSNHTNPSLQYVNSYPVTCIKNGIKDLSPRFFDGSGPDLAVTGPNIGSNLGATVLISGMVGAAVEAVKEGTPALAFSGQSGSYISYTSEPTPLYAQVYADLAMNVTSAVIGSGKPYLPDGVWPNVNFPEVNASYCSHVSDFRFILTRINTDLYLPVDVETCGSDRLMAESVVIGAGCYVTISPANAADKDTVNKATQAVVLKKLEGLLSCLP